MQELFNKINSDKDETLQVDPGKPKTAQNVSESKYKQMLSQLYETQTGKRSKCAKFVISFYIYLSLF